MIDIKSQRVKLLVTSLSMIVMIVCTELTVMAFVFLPAGPLRTLVTILSGIAATLGIVVFVSVQVRSSLL